MKKRLVKIIISLVVIFGVFALITAFSLNQAIKSTKKVSQAFKVQDLDAAKKSIKEAKSNFQRTNTTLLLFTPIRFIPIVGWYVADAQRGVSAAVSGLNAADTLAEAITPYADVLGLKGQGTFLGGTAQERIASVIQTLSKVSPQLDAVNKDLKDARTQIDGIQTWRYPNIIPGRPGEKIDTLKNSIDQIQTFLADAKPFIDVLPDIMGENKEKKYLVLIQNDKELRPTGGFITASALFRVNKGNITSEGSEDIYTLDGTLRKQVTAPDPVQKYLQQGTLHLRDSNLSPDFVTSMNLFQDLYNSSTSKKDFDGIIAINTKFVLDMIDVLGPIEALGTKFTNEKVDACACAQIIYELEKYADQPVAYEKDNRKGIIGVLMSQMMSKTFSAPKSAWPGLIGTMLSSLQDKDILIYLKDSKSQSAVERVNFAGRVYNYDGDYLSIVEANLGGAKSNLYVEEKAKLQVKKDKNNLSETLTIDYKYPRRGDNCSLERQGGLCLAGIYKDWIRIYVPKGAKLIKSSGAEVPFKATEDLGKTVFEGFFTVRPQGTAKLTIEYTVPLKVDNEYKLLIQKQPGNPGNRDKDSLGNIYEIDAFGKTQKGFPLTSDKELIVKL